MQDLPSQGIQEHKEKPRESAFNDGFARFKLLASKIGLLHRKRVMVLLAKATEAYAW